MAVELRVIEGRAVAVKSRTGDSARTALEAELRLLRSVSIDGVVRPIGDELTDDGELLLEVVGGGTLATNRPAADEVRLLGRRLVEVVSAVHGAGVVHGAIEASHVLWSRGGEPVLCGFGSATTGGDGADDVAALAALLGSLLPDDDPLASELQRAGTDLDRMATVLTTPTGHRPRLPRAGVGPSSSRRIPVRALLTSLGLLAVLGTLLVAVAPIPGRSGDDRSSAVSAPQAGSDPAVASAAPDVGTPAPTTAIAPTSTTDALVWPAPDPAAGCAPVTPGSLGSADVDGDGCDEPVDREGSMLVVDDRRWELGRPDDHVVLGDWWCEGSVTPALVTAADGAVHHFAEWPDDAPSVVAATAVVGSPSDVRVAAGDGCDVVIIERPDGTHEEVRA